jgi:hypothetical protein
MPASGDVPGRDPDGGDDGERGRFLARAGGVIAGSTLALTAAFVGVVALLDGTTAGIGDRFPFYVLAGAVVFVASLLLLDHDEVSGRTVIVATLVIAVTAFVVVGLGVEGVWYAYRVPGDVFGDQLVVYFLAAGLICTGLTYWGLNHWREFVGYDDADPRHGA